MKLSFENVYRYNNYDAFWSSLNKANERTHSSGHGACIDIISSSNYSPKNHLHRVDLGVESNYY